MKITIGKDGLTKTWQKEFTETTKCCMCKGISRIGFVAHEGLQGKLPDKKSISSLHTNGDDGFWLHDYCAVAVYFCKNCSKATAIYNQG